MLKIGQHKVVVLRQAAPFTCSFKNFKANACVWTSSKGASSCKPNASSTPKFKWLSQELDSSMQETMGSIQRQYMIYNYCSDNNRFPQGLPLECTITTS